MTAQFVVEPLTPEHDRAAFASGVEPLDRYLREQVSQDVRRRVTVCYVAVEDGTNRIVGYYTLSAAGVRLTDLPESLGRRLPRYPLVPVARLGRLAVDSRYRGQYLGAALLGDAVKRALRSEIAVFALAVDAKDGAAAAFYGPHGFVAFGSLPRQFILPLTSLRHAR